MVAHFCLGIRGYGVVNPMQVVKYITVKKIYPQEGVALDFQRVYPVFSVYCKGVTDNGT